MPWWGWLLVAVLGAGLLGALAVLAYLLRQLYRMFDSF